MAQPKKNNSLLFATAISAAVLLSTGGGWYLFKQTVAGQAGVENAGVQQSAVPADDIQGKAESAAAISAEATSVDSAIVTENTDLVSINVDDPESSPAAIVLDKPPQEIVRVDVDAELRKARLSAEAGLIVSPPTQNALYYYNRILEFDSTHELAIAEVGALLARTSLVIEEYLESDQFAAAYEIVVGAVTHMPGHAQVDAMNVVLDNYVSDIVEQAGRLAESGNDTEAADLLAELGQLPGITVAFVEQSQNSIAGIQAARVAVRQQVEEEEKLAAEQVASEWAQMVRDAIEAGLLIAPDGESARDYLSQGDHPEEVSNPLTRELFAALMTASEESLVDDKLEDVAVYLDAADELGIPGGLDPIEDGSEASIDAPADANDSETLSAQRDSVESKLLAAEGNKVFGLAEYSGVETVPAEYPFVARRRGITGWVEVQFTVTSNGSTDGIEVTSAEPADTFDDSAIEAVRQWTFEPRVFRGQPIDQRTAARLVFNLE